MKTATYTLSGLDARYMISRLQPNNVKVLSLTTVATPHRGSAFADYMFDTIGPHQIKRLYKVMEYFGLETEAFSQLTRNYMQTEFNSKTPNIDGIRYVAPTIWHAFLTGQILLIWRIVRAVALVCLCNVTFHYQGNGRWCQ